MLGARNARGLDEGQRGGRILFISTPHPARAARSDLRQESLANNAEQAGRQYAIGDRLFALPWLGTQVRARPGELVPLRHDDPRARAIESKARFHLRRNFNSALVALRPPVRDGQNQHAGFAIVIPDGCDNRAGSTFATFFASRQKLGAPEIGVANDETGERLWKRQIVLL